MRSAGFFVTGTDTEIGKTLVSTTLVHIFNTLAPPATGMKPVASGALMSAHGLRNDDALALQAVTATPPPYELVNPYAFEPPIAPHLAAAEAGVEIELEVILRAFDTLSERYNAVIVEGVGGWLVPFNCRQSVATLAKTLELPIVLVVGMRLGCINHALLTTRAIRAAGLTLAGWVANIVTSDFKRAAANHEALEARLDAPCVARLPLLSTPSPEVAAEYFDLDLLSNIR